MIPVHDSLFETSDLEKAELLEAAADVLETEGWCQRQYLKRGGGTPLSFCAMGAIGRAHMPKALHSLPLNGFDFHSHCVARSVIDTQQALGKHVNIECNDRSARPRLAAWNDELGRTKDEVIEAMRQCAKGLRNNAAPATLGEL